MIGDAMSIPFDGTAECTDRALRIYSKRRGGKFESKKGHVARDGIYERPLMDMAIMNTAHIEPVWAH